MRLASVLLLSLLSTSLGLSQPTNTRPMIGVALEGGGAKGLAHIGVLQWFEDHHIPIDYLAGTSMGGLVGGLYASGYSPAEIKDIVEGIDWNSVLLSETPYQDLAFRRKEDMRAIPNGLELGLKKGLQPPGGLNSGQAVRLIIDKYVLPYSRVNNFDELPTPFRCVATDLISGKPVVFQNGSLPDALRATMSIPGVFSPIREDGKVLADGGLLNNMPTDVVKKMGADVVIGIHLTTGAVTPANMSSMFQIAGGSTSVMIDANVLHSMEQADILVTVDVAGFSTLGFSKAEQIIPKGTEAAEARAGVLSRLRLSDEDWRQYRGRRESRIVKAVPTPQFVEVSGTSAHIAKDISEQFEPFKGQPVDTAQLEKKITQQIGLGRLNSLSYRLGDRNGTTGLLVSAEEKDYSPPWLKPGITIDGSDPNNVQFTFGGRLTFLDVGGYRSELRADFTIGSTYSFASEYYHPVKTTSRWFVAPQIYASRSPLNIYSQSELLAEYKLNQAGGGMDVGYGFNRSSELRFGYQAGYASASRWVGSPLLPDVSGRTGVTRVRYVMDRLDNPIIPHTGTALQVSGGWTDANPGASRDFPTSELGFETFHPITKRGSAYVIASGGTTYGYKDIGVPPFTLGGPSRLAAYGVNEFLADQYFYFRAGYLHRLWDIPPFLGKGIYLDGHFEMARPYGGLTTQTGLLNDGVVGLVTQTLLGPILVGGAIGDGGHRKWFFQLGHVF